MQSNRRLTMLGPHGAVRCTAFLLSLAVTLPAAAEGELALRRQQIANMTLSEQQQLLRNQQRFNELPTADQDRLRKLHADLQAEPNQSRLRQVLERYHEWLKTLSPEQRAELAELGMEARVQRVGELMARQRKEHSHRRPRFDGDPIPKEDLQAIYKWFGDLVWQHRAELLAEIPQPRREQVERLDDSMLRKSLMFTAIQRGRTDPLPIEQADYERLLKELSPETRDKLARAPSPQQKKRLTREWLGQAMMARMNSFSMRRAMAGVSEEDLQRFFKNLPETDRERLLGLPRDQMQEELKQLYLQRQSRPDGPPGPPRFDRPSFGPPFGPPDHHRPDHPGRPEDRNFPPRVPLPPDP